MANEQPALVIIQGSDKGKSFPLSNDPIRMGSDKSCQLCITGSHIAPVHAVVSRVNKQWIIESRGDFSLFVNRQKVDRHNLMIDDVVQIGSESLIRFEMIKAKEQKGNRASALSSSGAFSIFKNPIVAVGLGLWFAVLGGGAVYLSDYGEPVEMALQKTNPQLKKEMDQCIQLVEDNPSDYRWMAEDGANTGLTAVMYRLLDEDGDKKNSHIKQKDLKKKIREQWETAHFRAWALAGEGRLNDAIIQYQYVGDIVPDIRCQVALYASQQVGALRKRYNDGE